MKSLFNYQIYIVIFVLLIIFGQRLFAQTISDTNFPMQSPAILPTLSSPAVAAPDEYVPQNNNAAETTQNTNNQNELNTTPNNRNEPKKITTKKEKHDAIVLFNPSSGHSVVLPGSWSVDVLEDFAKFLIQGNENINTPNFTINSILAKGNLVNSKIEATIQFNITTNSEKNIKIPLGLKEGVFPPAPNNKAELSYKYSGKSKFNIAVDSIDGQYIAVISPPVNAIANNTANQKNTTENKTKENINATTINPRLIPTPNAAVTHNSTTPKIIAAGEQHEITLDLWFPVSKLADGSYKLPISFPHAISSQFILTIPSLNITANTQAPLINATQINNEATQFTILGLKPNFDITWRKQNTKITEPRPVLEIKDANIRVQFEPRLISYDATLPVRSLQNTFDKFLVRLPKDATPDLENSEKFAANGGYAIRLLSEEERNAINKQKNKSNNQPLPQSNQTPVIEIQTPQKTMGPLNVRLIATRRLQATASAADASDWSEIEGFDVLGAQRQYGALSITIPDGMRPNWRSIRGINRIDYNPASTQDDVAAQFRFSLQPFLLRGQIITPQVRTNIKPEYQVKIEKGNASMIMRLACTAPWSQIHSLSVQLFDWQWNGEITPANIINVAGIEQTADGILNIPLSNVPENDFEIELKLNKKFDADKLPHANNMQPERKLLSLRFPQPQASWVEPLIVAIVSGDNVELTPVVDSADPKMPHTTGLTRVNRRTLKLNIDLPQRQREPLIYKSDLQNPIFVAETEFHKQKLEANINTNIKLLDQKEQINETISYDVAYEPVDRIYLATPKTLDTQGGGDFGGFQAFIGNTILRIRDAATTTATTEENNAEQDKNNYVKKIIMLPEAMIGKFDISIKYTIPQVNVSEDLSESVLIPFVKPLNVKINSHRVNLIAPAGVNAELREESKLLWKNTGTISPIIVAQINAKQNNRQDNITENKIAAKIPEIPEQPQKQAKITPQKQRTIIFESTFYGLESKNANDNILTNIDPERLSLLISASERGIFGATIIERAWIQTWVADNARVDRAIYAVNTSRDMLVIRMPERVAPAKITVKKNGAAIPVELNNESALMIPLYESETAQTNTIELWYQQPGIFRNKIQQVKFDLPKFDENVFVRREYWQLILPPNKFIPFSPNGWTPEYRQKYGDIFAGQKMPFTMEDAGISTGIIDNVIISENASQFLFSSVALPEAAAFWLVDGSVIFLASSLAALAAGLVLVYFPKTRYFGFVFGLVIFLSLVLFYQPVSGLLFLQAATLGIILAIAAGYVYKLCYSEKQWILPAEKTNATEVYSVIIDESTDKTNEYNNSKSATIVRS
ncbi:MAG: hypothetical protein LBP59_14950 [Planctomycetaceae bacterium]|nr:hypothetical protein [Planctomycetaceae bacterium]